MEVAMEEIEEPDPVVQPSTSAPTIFTETVAETPRVPLLLAKHVTAAPAPTKSRPWPPTSAAKCSRPSVREPTGEPKKKKKRINLTALQEIREYQSEVKPLLPSTSFHQGGEKHFESAGAIQDYQGSYISP